MKTPRPSTREPLPCGCVPHETEMTNIGFHCITEDQGYCNFECPHWPASIIVNGRRWFDKINGNTYHSVMVEVTDSDGETTILVEPFAYGYDNQYQQTAYEMMVEKGILPKLTYENGIDYGLRRTCERLGVELHTTVRDGRKRDLHKAEEVV